jgi:hypothetical protein
VNATTEEPTSSPVPPATSPDIDERYGRTPRDRRRVRTLAWTAASGFAVVLIAWLVWGGVLEGLDKIEAQNIGHTVLNDKEVEVVWNVTAEPGDEVSCALQALNESFSIVGWKIVELPPTEERTRELTEVVRTTELSVTGLIYRCWLS